MNAYNTTLKELCKIFLQEEDHYYNLYDAADRLYTLFCEASGIELESVEAREDIYLPSGKAIGTTWAAMCVKEFMRTKQFLHGIYKAIKAAQEKFPDETIHILYAGTGPFATLAIPFTTLFSPQEIQFTFLEINSESIRLLQNVIAAFNAEPYIEDVVQCDATRYRVDPATPIHMVITETMLNALQKEPQVSITINLVPQMVEGGILIPENISIEAVMLSHRRNTLRMMDDAEYDGEYCHVIDSIFEFNKETAVEYLDGFPVVMVEPPSDLPKDYSELCLFTTIRVYEDVILHPWQCSLNLPQKILRLNADTAPANTVSFQYHANEHSRFHVTID